MKILLTMNTRKQSNPPPPPPPPPLIPAPALQIPAGYVILKLSGRDYVVPEFLTRSTRHAVESVQMAEDADIYGQPSGVSYNYSG